MLTVEDVAAIPLFSTLPRREQERLARTSADLRLSPGEFAVPEGGERALFAVLSGKIEVIKTIDGVERTLGWRVPGTNFGEVPIALGTPFPGGYRAAEPSRVMRVDIQEYYATAAVSKDISLKVSALARERIGGLQSIADEPRKPRVILVGQRWDTECANLRRFLARNQISFNWLTPEAPELATLWPGPRPQDSDGPALLTDGQVMVRPQVRDLANRLGLQTSPRSDEYDVAIIGGGPAGLAAAVYGASEGLRTIIVEREAPGGQAGTSSRIENYLGFPSGVSGDELANRALQQAKRLGAEILVTRSVSRVDPITREVFLDGGEVLRARTLILATGVSWRRLEIDGLDRLIGKGVYYGAARSEASATHGQDIHLVGAGNSAGQAALHFANHARKVTLVVRGDNLEKRCRTISSSSSVADAETEWLPANLARDKRGYVLTGDDLKKAGSWSHSRDPYLLETSVPGVFACGDVRLSPVKRVASAVGEGSMAIAFVHQYLVADAQSQRTRTLRSAPGPQRTFVPVPPSSEGEAITDLQGRVANPIHSDSRCQVHGAVGEDKKPPKDQH